MHGSPVGWSQSPDQGGWAQCVLTTGGTKAKWAWAHKVSMLFHLYSDITDPWCRVLGPHGNFAFCVHKRKRGGCKHLGLLLAQRTRFHGKQTKYPGNMIMLLYFLWSSTYFSVFYSMPHSIMHNHNINQIETAMLFENWIWMQYFQVAKRWGGFGEVACRSPWNCHTL